MQSCNQMHASYLFQQDKHYDLSYDTGDKALQCGRHVDVFKLWLMWRAKVSTGQLNDSHRKKWLLDGKSLGQFSLIPYLHTHILHGQEHN